MKQMPPNVKHIILANVNVKVYSWPLAFRKVVRQQILMGNGSFNSIFEVEYLINGAL